MDDLQPPVSQSVESQPIEPSLFHSIPKWRIYLGFILLVILFAIAYLTLAVYQNLWPFDFNLVYVPVNLITHSPNSSAVPFDWKTYTNSQYGFEMKYPRNSWIDISESPDSISINTDTSRSREKFEEYGGDVNIFIDLNPKNIIAKEFYNGKNEILLFDNPQEDKEIFVGGVKAFFNYPTTGIAPAEVIIIPFGNYFLRIENYGEEGIFNQILSTFKFIEPKSGTGSFCGGIAAIKCPLGYSCKLDGGYPDAGGKCEISIKNYTGVCTTVITPAKNKVTGEIHDFPSPCNVSDGWEIFR